MAEKLCDCDVLCLRLNMSEKFILQLLAIVIR